jgi:hypothetical protein
MRSRLFLAAVPLLWGATAAHATVHVAIDLTHQRMHVDGDEGSYDWPISSARSGFSTPGGSYAPTHLELMHYSRKYHMSPMPHAIFFRGGYAIHGTYSTGSLGRPASHGCVRLSPGNATTLYAMVRHEGARISISGAPPASAPFAVARHRSRGYEEESARYADSDGFEAPRRVRRYAAPAYASPAYGYGGGYPYGYGQPAYYGYDATSLSPF